MPAVQTEAHLGVIVTVRADDLRQAGVRRRKFGVVRLAVVVPRIKIVGAAEIILRARAADGWEFAVAINVKLCLTLAPPAAATRAPCEVSAHVLHGALVAAAGRSE